MSTIRVTTSSGESFDIESKYGWADSEILRDIVRGFEENIEDITGAYKYSTVSFDDDFAHELIEESKRFCANVQRTMSENSADPADINQDHQRVLLALVLERSGFLENLEFDVMRAVESAEIIENEEEVNLHSILDEDQLDALREKVLEAAHKDLLQCNDPGSFLSSLLDKKRTEFIYIPGLFKAGLSIVEDDIVTFTTGYSDVASMELDARAEDFFSMMNVCPHSFANHLEGLGYGADVVSGYRNMHASYSSTRPPLVGYPALLTIIENSYKCCSPMVFADVDLATLLCRDITSPIILERPLVGLHDHVFGAGYIEEGSAFQIEPNDLDFTGGGAFRYSVNGVYGFTNSYMRCDLLQPYKNCIYHEDLSPADSLLEKVEVEMQTQQVVERLVPAPTLPSDKKNWSIMRSAFGGQLHLKPLPADEARLLCAIHEAINPMPVSSSTQEAQFQKVLNLVDRFPNLAVELRSKGLIEAWNSNAGSRSLAPKVAVYLPTALGEVYCGHEKKRLLECELVGDNDYQA